MRKKPGRAKNIFLKIIFLFILLSPQISEALQSTSGPFPHQTQINMDIIRGIQLLYDWEFDQAEGLFNKVIAEKPKDPAGYFYLAMATWSRLAAGFWSPENVRQYGERIERSVSVARKRIENGAADGFTYFYLGAALGFKGRFQLMKRKWLSSFFLALEAIDALKTCLKMDPNNRDALYGLGFYDYYTARLSGVLRFLSYLLLRKGDKKEGLRKLHIAANEAIYSAIEAKNTLLHIYLFLEPGYYQARPLAEELAERFKEDPRNKHLQGVTYIRLGLDSEYREVVDFFSRRSRMETSLGKASMWGNRGLYLEAGYYLFQDQYDRARSKLEIILSNTDSGKDPFMIAWPLLKIGMSYDLEGKREKALEYYNRILEMENGAGAQFLADKYIDTPVKGTDPFLGY